ncbi:MAG TPA: glycosyltransferase family 1 protein [Candidatus Moranbacteria bacterium]|nr:glycosyltransferase family 1 protein [Candidatus Moranbacteria bacterium]
MRIGIDGSRAFIQQRTGIEEYAYQCIKRLRKKLNSCPVILYIRPKSNSKIDFELPNNWKVKVIKFPYFWTQVGLSLEMLFHPVDILFVPAHTLPIIHPKNSVVVIHGLEYEFCPQAYAWKDKFYMRWTIKKSCQWANKIISVSENTKQDLIKLYKIPPKKIEVIYEGVSDNFQFSAPNLQEKSRFKIPNSKFLLFIGRLEKRKNIEGIIEAFEILKEKYNLPHKLVLVGKKGYKYENIKAQILKSKYKKDIIEMGYILDKDKRALLKKASVFLFPSFYEGFGLPILEAQSLGAPVITSNNSSLREITANNFQFLASNSQLNFDDQTFNRKKEIQSSALLINPHNPGEIAKATWKLISDKNLRDDIIKKGYKNVKRFSWEKCADHLFQHLVPTLSFRAWSGISHRK